MSWAANNDEREGWGGTRGANTSGGGSGNAEYTRQQQMIRNGMIGTPQPTQFDPNAPVHFDKFKEGGLWGMNVGANMVRDQPDLSGQYQGAVDGMGRQINNLQNFDATSGLQNNPFMGGMNPFQQGLQSFANPQQNPYLNQMMNTGMDSIQDRVNSQFGLSGRNGSGAHVGNMTKELGNYANNFLGGQYQSDMNRGVQAATAGANSFNQWQGNNQNAFNQGMQNYLTGSQQNLDASKSAMLGYGQIPGMLDSQANAPWQGINNYASIVNQLSGTQPAPRNKKDPFDNIIGLGMMASGFV